MDFAYAIPAALYRIIGRDWANLTTARLIN
jgi:hypothetical protein